MGTGYTRQSSAEIITGADIVAAPLNAEFNQLQSAFNSTTGHTHDGTSGEGPLINLTTSITGTLPIVNGGTGATTASAARTSLGLVIGTDIQAYDAGLQSISGLTTAADKMIYTTALDTYAVADLSVYARTLLDDVDASTALTTLGFSTYGKTLIDDVDAATARTTLGLGTIATQASSSVSITGGTITGITDLAVADGGTGASTAADARTNLGLGTISTQSASAVSIMGGTIAGITDLAVVDGGTGASTAADARTNLGLGTISTQNSNSVSITGGSVASSVLQGTATNDDAAAGKVGEYQEASVLIGAAGSISSTVTNNMQSLSLTAGDWEVGIWVGFLPTGPAVIQQLQCGISLTSATLPSAVGMVKTEQFASISLGSGTQTIELAPKRISLSTTTTVYGVHRAIFSSGSVSAFGLLYARRVR